MVRKEGQEGGRAFKGIFLTLTPPLSPSLPEKGGAGTQALPKLPLPDAGRREGIRSVKKRDP